MYISTNSIQTLPSLFSLHYTLYIIYFGCWFFFLIDLFFRYRLATVWTRSALLSSARRYNIECIAVSNGVRQSQMHGNVFQPTQNGWRKKIAFIQPAKKTSFNVETKKYSRIFVVFATQFVCTLWNRFERSIASHNDYIVSSFFIWSTVTHRASTTSLF